MSWIHVPSGSVKSNLIRFPAVACSSDSNNPILANVDCENRATVPGRGEKNISLDLADALAGNTICFGFRNSNIIDCHLRTIATIGAVPVRQNKARAALEFLYGRDFGGPDRLPEPVFAAESESNISSRPDVGSVSTSEAHHQ